MTDKHQESLRTLAESVKGWDANDVWRHEDCEYTAVLGNISEDGEQYPIAEINADTYGHDGESLALAKFYAAANPLAVLALLDRIAKLEADLVSEVARTANQKIRADQMTKQHDTQAALNREARNQIAQLTSQLEAIGAGGVESLRKK